MSDGAGDPGCNEHPRLLGGPIDHCWKRNVFNQQLGLQGANQALPEYAILEFDQAGCRRGMHTRNISPSNSALTCIKSASCPNAILLSK